MVVNSFIFALPIVGQAQSIEKQAIAQAELTATQKAELEKAQKDARLAMYKELKLSTVEKKFVEKYADKLESFNQTIDKYVNYNKTNGNATVDVTAIYKNMKAIRAITGLTQNEVLTVKDIALKMVKNYNKEISKIQIFSRTNTNDTLKVSSLSSQEENQFKIAKTFEERGVKIQYEIPAFTNSKLDSNTVQKASSSCYAGKWLVNKYVYWWGTNSDRRMNMCGFNQMITLLEGLLNNTSTGTSVGCTIAGFFGGWLVGIPCNAAAIALKWVAQNYINTLRDLSRTCNRNVQFWETSHNWGTVVIHSFSCKS